MAFQPTLFAAVADRTAVRPGEPFTVTFHLRNTGDAPAEFPCESLVRFEHVEERRSFTKRYTPAHPTDAWPANAEFIDGPHTFVVPSDAPEGAYRVSVAYFEPYTLNAKPPEWPAGTIQAITVDRAAPGAPSLWSAPLDETEIAKRQAELTEHMAALNLESASLETDAFALHVDAQSGAFSLHDRRSGATWTSNPFGKGFATLYLRGDGRAAHVQVNRFSHVETKDGAIVMHAVPHVDGVDVGVRVRFEIRIVTPERLQFAYSSTSTGDWSVIGARLLDQAFWTTDADKGAAVIPHRLGLQLDAGAGEPNIRQFAHYTVHDEGYSMAFCGMTKGGAALLFAWDDLDARLEVRHTPVDEPHIPGSALIAPSLIFKGASGACTVHALGPGDYVTIAKAYREVAKERGLLRPWSEKRRRFPSVDLLAGAADFKPFVLRRTLPFAYRNPTDQEIVQVQYTADEVATLAEHWRRDLEIDRAMVVLAGWIHRGYDNQHPDILPAAPEIGGDAGVAEAAARVKACGYLFGLHDNYQDMYKDAPSWDEGCLIHLRDGAPMKGGVWLGGQAYHMTGRAGLELARRPANLPEVKRRFDPTVYFIDTTLASPLFESWAPTPQTKDEDLEARRALIDVAKDLFGVFGSEEGVEWGVPHADYFEGIMSHKFRTPADAPVVPLFPIVYGDCVQLLPHQSDVLRTHLGKWVLDNILYAALPLYHFGDHLYHLETPKGEQDPGLEPQGLESVFARADQGWAEGMHPTDRMIKNTYEVLSYLNRITFDSPMTDHARLTPDGSLQMSRFGDVRVVVNYGPQERELDGALLPAYGFVIEGPTFIAFHALRYAGVEYPGGALFTARSLDGAPIASSSQVRIYHGFGPTRLRIAGREFEVAREEVVSMV